jgi:anti-sigma regulatory factor (Ser/Thr protein kinase)
MHVKIEAVDVVKTSCLPSMELTFDTVDELCLAAARDRLKNVAGLSVVGVGRLGPAVEFFHSRVQYSIISGVQVDASVEWEALRSAAERSVISGNGLGDSFGFFPLSRKGDSDEELWTSWLSRAQAAAERAGFGKPIAHGFIGAILELEGNVEEHSERVSTGIVGYRREDEEFEFVVADRGVGVLASLRTSIEFRTLNDAGTALRLALQDGVSRFDGDPARGFGFRQLFLTLASLEGSLRFRSDDHAMVIAGRGPKLSEASLIQKAGFSGFAVSVSCRSRAER